MSRVNDRAVVAGSILGVLAVAEVVARPGASGAGLAAAVVLALGATVPLALVRFHLLGASLAVLTANALGLLGSSRPTVAGGITALVVTYLLGSGYVRRRRAEAAERSASHQSMADAWFENVARGERVRIARELHDVVAHHISMVVVQAESARLTTPGMPPEGAERLGAIGDTARAALTEMRRLLGVLREDTGAGPTRQPQPGLQQLIELVDEARDASGATIRLIVRGRIAALDPGVELTVYRLVQEALTNARRHAPGASIDIELEYAAGMLVVRVRDSGPGPAPGVQLDGAGAGAGAGGHGLLGMRERVIAARGDLRIGPAGPAGGLLVEAELPLSAPAPVGSDRPAEVSAL